MSRKSMQTRMRLAEALAELIYQYPLNKITIKMVTSIAGIDRQTFYYHFSTLNDLLVFLAKIRMDEFINRIPAHASTYDIFLATAHQILRYREALDAMLHALGRNLFREIFYPKIRELLHERIDLMLEDSNIDQETRHFTTEYCMLASASILELWAHQAPGHQSPEQIARMLDNAFLAQFNGVRCTIKQDISGMLR